MGINLFIAGIEKCGTSSLAEWLVGNGLASYRVAGVKEPGTYADADFTDDDESPRGVLLDATVGYASSSEVLSRMPVENTRIILCIRNQFDRTFSAYSFKKALAQRGQDAKRLFETMSEDAVDGEYDEETLFHAQLHDYKKWFPPEAEWTIQKYFVEQAERISQQSFGQRVDYEIGFFLSRRTFPLLSILGASSLYFPLRNLLQKYDPRRIFLVTVDQLQSEHVRRDFVNTVLGERVKTLPPLGQLNVTSGLHIARSKPNFRHHQWDRLRGYFHQDWLEFMGLVEHYGVSLRYVNTRMLKANLHE